jgi:hypothetical protein
MPNTIIIHEGKERFYKMKNNDPKKGIKGIKIAALVGCVAATAIEIGKLLDDINRGDREMVAKILAAEKKTDYANFIYRDKDLTKEQVYVFIAEPNFTPSHFVFGENEGSIPSTLVQEANKRSYEVIPNMDLYYILNSEGHIPVANTSKIYAVDFNHDRRIAGVPVSKLEKTTIEACRTQRAIRDKARNAVLPARTNYR